MADYSNLDTIAATGNIDPELEAVCQSIISQARHPLTIWLAPQTNAMGGNRLGRPQEDESSALRHGEGESTIC